MESKFVSFEPRGDKTEFTIYSIDQSLDVLVPIENTSIISKKNKREIFWRMEKIIDIYQWSINKNDMPKLQRRSTALNF